jgi:serine/threonine protein kinase
MLKGVCEVTSGAHLHARALNDLTLICGLQAADIWACGVVLFVLLTKTYPFRRDEDVNLKPSHKAIVMLQVRNLPGVASCVQLHHLT